jgi:hypothetical protein
MAYVAITANLIHATKNIINIMRDAEVTALGDFEFVPSGELVDALEKKFWGEHHHLIALIPDTWQRESRSTVGFKIRGRVDGNMFSTYKLRANLPRAMRIPPKDRERDQISRFADYEQQIWLDLDSVFVQELGLPAEMTAPLQERADALASFHARWKKVETEIVAYLEGSKSLNEALKLWPQVAVYIEKGYLDKVKVKSDRSATASRAAELLQKMDTENAMLSAVSARMAQAA